MPRKRVGTLDSTDPGTQQSLISLGFLSKKKPVERQRHKVRDPNGGLRLAD